MRFLLTYSFLILCCFAAISQNILDGSLVGYSVVDVKSGEVIAEKNGNVAFIPASVTKVITTASVMEIIPVQKRFETLIEYNGEILNGTLYGKLIVKGCGDPTLGSSYIDSSKERVFDDILTVLKRNGITSFCGEIVCDDSFFPYNGERGAWLAEDLGNYFAAESYGFNFADNLYTLYLNSGEVGESVSIVKCDPVMPELNFINRLCIEDCKRDSAYIYGVDFCNTRVVGGAIPCNRSLYKLKGSVPSPANLFIREFRNFLIEKGVWVECDNVAAKGLRNYSLGAIFSAPLIDIVKITNHKSNNLYAETLLKWCGLIKCGVATTQNGIDAVLQIWNERGVDLSNVLLFDGCGLSPKNRISPNALAQILCKASINEAFKNSLPKVGVEGTVKNFMRNSAIAKHLSLKTGSMQGVQCYAGYYDNGDNCFAVVIMVNNFKCKRKVVQEGIGKLIENLLNN